MRHISPTAYLNIVCDAEVCLFCHIVVHRRGFNQFKEHLNILLMMFPKETVSVPFKKWEKRFGEKMRQMLEP